LSAKEEEAKAEALNHVTNAAFPALELAPWMSSYNFKIMVALSKMSAIARIAEKADKNAWIDLHPGQPLPDSMKEGEKKDEEMAEEFDVDIHARGAAAAYAYGVGALVHEIHNRAVSVNQLGRKQAIALGIGASSRTGPSGVAEYDAPAKKHFWSKQPKQETAGLR
jgi:hypothetical protein